MNHRFVLSIFSVIIIHLWMPCQASSAPDSSYYVVYYALIRAKPRDKGMDKRPAPAYLKALGEKETKLSKDLSMRPFDRFLHILNRQGRGFRHTHVFYNTIMIHSIRYGEGNETQRVGKGSVHLRVQWMGTLNTARKLSLLDLEMEGEYRLPGKTGVTGSGKFYQFCKLPPGHTMASLQGSDKEGAMILFIRAEPFRPSDLKMGNPPPLDRSRHPEKPF